MKKWLVAAALAAGCQPAGTATTSQDLAAQDCYGVANFCGKTLPPLSSWFPGDPFPQSTANTVVLFLRESATWQVFGADPVIGQVLWRRTVKPAGVGAFMNLLGSMNLAYGGVRPPPPVGCPPICIEPPALVLATALRILPVQQQAQDDAAACPAK